MTSYSTCFFSHFKEKRIYLNVTASKAGDERKLEKYILFFIRIEQNKLTTASPMKHGETIAA
jgi:hypothetical protein